MVLALISCLAFWYVYKMADEAMFGSGIIFLMLIPTVWALDIVAIVFGMRSVRREINFPKAFGIIGLILAAIPIVLTIWGVWLEMAPRKPLTCLYGDSRAYFDKRFISIQESNLRKEFIATAEAEAGDCREEIYKVNVMGSFSIVDKSDFDKFLQTSDASCNDCLVYAAIRNGAIIDFHDYPTGQTLVVDTNTTPKTFSETEIINSLKTNWQTLQASFANRPEHPGTVSWLGPYTVQFIGKNNLLVGYEDGYVASMNILSYKNGEFKTLETFNNRGLFTLSEWQDLVKKYGDSTYPVSSYSINAIRNNEIISFEKLTKVPENVFVKLAF